MVQFEWAVTRTGYRWELAHRWDQPPSAEAKRGGPPTAPTGAVEQDRSAPAWCLTDGVPIGESRKVRRYVPLRVPDLFRDFAATELSESGILTFAQKFGSLLGLRAGWVRLPDEDHRRGTRAFYYGEELGLWRDEIRRIRIAVELLDLLAAGRKDALKSKVVWVEPKQVQYRTGPDEPGDVIASSHIENERLLPRFRYGEVVKPAWFYLQRVVNDGLEGNVSPGLLWDTQDRELNMFLVPYHLLGFLWLQCARAVERDVNYRKCQACREWFRVGAAAGGARADKRFCSVRCRVQWFRRPETGRSKGRGKRRRARRRKATA
jgi:hypothetical protein